MVGQLIIQKQILIMIHRQKVEIIILIIGTKTMLNMKT